MAALRSFDKDFGNRVKNNPTAKRDLKIDLILSEIGAKLALYRHKHHLTQADLAKLANVPQSSVARIENGSNINLKTLINLTEAMHQEFYLKIPV